MHSIRTPRRRPARRHSLIAAAVLALAPSMALAQPAQGAVAMPAGLAFDIPAQPLDAALAELARQGGLQLMVAPPLVQGRTAGAVRGRLSAEAAARQLLQGSGLAARIDGATLVVERAGEAASLAEIRVQARRDSSGATEGTGSYTGRITSIASKTDQSFREIPQSVSVATRAQLEEQRATDVTEALKLMPGIVVANTVGDYYSRGFQITSMQVDGGAPMALGAYTYVPQQDMAFYDRVEVMRGASGLLGGSGDPGGIINIVRKKPLAQRQVTLAMSAGSWQRRGLELDASAPLALEGRVRGRAVLAYEKGDEHLDLRSVEKPALYGVLEADLTPDTLLTLGASYGRNHENGDYAGMPRYTDGRALGLPRSANFTQPWAYYDYTRRELFAQLEHRFANHWKLKFNAARAETELDRYWTAMGGAVNPQTLAGSIWRGGHIQSANTQETADVHLAGPFQLLGRTHELLLGVDWQRVGSHWMSGNFDGSGTVAGNPFGANTWTPSTRTYFNSLYSPWGQKQTGAYGVLRLHPRDDWHVVLGARAARYDYQQAVWTLDAAGTATPWSNTPFREPTKVTPYGGVIHDLNDQWSAYVSYSAIYKPQALSMSGPPPGTSLPPVTGRSYEAGLKGELREGRLNATFSVFHVERTGTAVRDPAYEATNNRWTGNCCFLPSGKVTSRGFDMEVGGEVLPGWQLAAGYTFNNTKDESTRLTYSSITPRHLLKLSTSYQLPGALSQWKVGGSAHVQSTHYVSGTALVNGVSTAYDFTQGGYAVWNAMVQYRIDPRWSLTLNVNNLFDKTYWRQLGSTFSNNVYAPPRSAMLTLRGSF